MGAGAGGRVGARAEGTRMSGILALPEADYHADELGLPNDHVTLSASIAFKLCAQSPAHARAAHPKLNPAFERREEQKFDPGNAAHALFLEGRDAVQVVDANDWRTKSAKEELDEARAAGKLPLLAAQWDEVQAMCAAVREQLAVHHADPRLFEDGAPEQTLVWEEDGVVCRARLDWLRDDHRTVDDLKTTSRSANPDAYSRALYGVGGDVQAAFYVRGVKALTGTEPAFRWAVVETTPPYALSVVAPSPGMLEIGNAKVEYALALWARCLESGEWPGYPVDVCYAELPPYEEARWLAKEEREAA